WARRRGEFRDPDGSLVAVSTVDWVLLDQRGRLIRIPEDFGVAFPNPEIDGEIIRVVLPSVPADAATVNVRVGPQHLDPMGHVNNAVYLDWVEEAVAAAGGLDALVATPRRAKIEYAASAEPGDVAEANAWRDDSGWWVRLIRPRDDMVLVRGRLEVIAGD
ncbi:MAG: hypothetical protein ABI598_00965, partial [Chloroflexota bacterium]